MAERVGSRIEDLLRRAGVSGVPSSQALVVVLLACACVGWCAWRWWPRSAPEEFASAPAAESAGGDERTQSREATTGAVVHVAGAVRRAGVYELPAGSRVADALAAAGGPIGDAAPEALNLARILQDGEQIVLPTREEWETGGSAGGSVGTGAAAGGASGPSVDLNTADAAALDTLPGIGPATAARIVEDREANGPFVKPEDLMRVSGIGPKKFDALKDLVTVR